MAQKTRGPRTDQKRGGRDGARDGKVNQYQPEARDAVGSHKPGGDGTGRKRFKTDHDVAATRRHGAVPAYGRGRGAR